jgi:hypothetical protein
MYMTPIRTKIGYSQWLTRIRVLHLHFPDFGLLLAGADQVNQTAECSFINRVHCEHATPSAKVANLIRVGKSEVLERTPYTYTPDRGCVLIDGHIRSTARGGCVFQRRQSTTGGNAAAD